MARKPNPDFPSRAKLIEATFDAIVACNGSATNDEIQELVIQNLDLADAVVNVLHADGVQTKLHYELRWARTYLKKYGAIRNSVRGIWVLVSGFENNTKIDGNAVCIAVREKDSKKDLVATKQGDPTPPQNVDTLEIDDEPWRAELSKILHEMDPYGFERLAMRLLRECGFSKVSVTKGSGDNGIDGFGKVSLNGIVTINVAFQCKRYTGLVSSAQIRDFRGSLPAGVEKGIFITTGAFSNAAIQAASDSSMNKTIDLIDGEDLISLLLEHELGVSKETRTVYTIQKSFFDEI